MRRLVGILGVAVVALLPHCSEDTNKTMPSEAAKTTETGTQSLQPAVATDDRTFAEARADAVPLIRKAMDELDKVDNTSTPGSNLGHVAGAMDLVEQAGDIFDGVDNKVARHLHIAADHLIGAASAIGSSPKATGATHELHVAAEHIDAANELLGLAITT